MCYRKYKQQFVRHLIKYTYLNDILERPIKSLRYSKKLTKTPPLV